MRNRKNYWFFRIASHRDPSKSLRTTASYDRKYAKSLSLVRGEKWWLTERQGWSSDVARIVEQSLGGIPPGTKCDIYLKKAVHLWLSSRLESKQSLRRYARAFRQYVIETGLRRLAWHERVGSGLLTGYCRHLRDTASPRTVNCAMSVLRSWYSWMHDHGLIPSSPFRWREHLVPVDRRRLYHPNRVGHIRRALTIDQAAQVIATARHAMSPRQYAAIALLACAGLRQGEVRSLQIDDLFDEDGKPCLTVRGKGNRTRTLFLEPIVVDAIARYQASEVVVGRPTRNRPLLLSRRGNEICSDSFALWVRSAGNRVGRPDLTPHELRRTYATLIRERGAQLEEAQHQLGHASLDTTKEFYDMGDRRNRSTTGLQLPREAS